ncbi:MAG TPA: phospho-sugar mutase [Candidatus Rikenella faecigallinarum]|uniref:Phospho-sugar mutase n=1 Tax=Candidatus Rikenella faecigallinarum TaxID=2838745 RepID=A0A9D1QDW7_9BACT|nr:phospho-sugar mutase [Candidatus Rikenella faecigallinarum]
MDNLDKIVAQRAQQWLEGGFDEQTKAAVRNMMENDLKELTESFYQTLEFGTGGLRGIMGVGTNRMNIYTVGMATQGLANYLKKSFPGQEIKVAVAHDCRNNSDLFAKTTAEVFAANGFTVYLFDSLRPTPELSFAIRYLGCMSGVVVTASHNPKEYNGYKAYWNDGAQVIAPHDANIIDEVNKISDIAQVKFSGGDGKIVMIGEEVDKAYLDMIAALSLSPEAVKAEKEMKIVYTPIHGTGVKLVPASLKRFGFENVIHVPEQDVNDGNFPTVVSPNPEEPSALKLALAKADETGADLVIATDPDADRIGIAVRQAPEEGGGMLLLNGNQTGTLLTYYLLERWKELGKLHPNEGKEFVVKTVVTTELIARIAASFGVECFDVLTGFKFIAAVIREYEGKKQFVGGGEESYGYLIGDSVRDKDAVASASMVAECAAWAKHTGKGSLLDLLKAIYVKYGFFKEGLVSVVRKGKEGQEEIKQMMVDFRNQPPVALAGSPVVEVRDYKEQYKIVRGVREPMDHLPKSDVLQFVTEDSTIVSVRPSGTEPKIKFYFGVREPLADVAHYDAVNAQLGEKIERIKKELKLV